MTAATDAILVAIVGVAGTLFSPLVSSWVLTRNKRQEFELNRQEKKEERDRTDQHNSVIERRDCYIAFNMAAREYHGALRAKSHAIDRAESSGDSEKALNMTRRGYRLRYAEAQMIIPDGVLELASQINGMLADAYGMIRRIEENAEEDGETPDTVRAILDEAWVPLRLLRAEMRADLGVSRKEA